MTLILCRFQSSAPVLSTSDASITPNPPIMTAASSLSPATLPIHFRHSNSDKRQAYNDLRAQILAKAQNIVTPLQNSYPEAVKFLSYLLKQIVDSNMRAEDKEKPEKKHKDESFKTGTTPVVETIRSSEEYALKRPAKYSADDFYDAESETTTSIDILKETEIISNEINYSEQVETDDFSLTQNEGLSISIESTTEATTVPKSRLPKPSRNKDTKNKKNNKNKKSMVGQKVEVGRSKKTIKNFKDLQQVLEKEVSAKQEERLRYQKDVKESHKKKQKKEESEAEDATNERAEIEKIINEVKNKRKKKSSGPASLVSKDDKNASIRKLIEEILSKKEKVKESDQTSQRRPIEPQLDYDEKKEKEPSVEDEETEAESDKITTVTSSYTSKPKIQKLAEEKKSIENNKESFEIEKEVKKKVKRIVHKKTPSTEKPTEIRSTLLDAEEILAKNFKPDKKVPKKGRNPKTATPMSGTIKIKSSKTTRKRAFDFILGGKSAKKSMGSEDENISIDVMDTIENCNSGSSKEKTFTLPQRLKKEKAKIEFMPPFETDDESPMLLPPAMTDFQLATRNRLVTTINPILNPLKAELVFIDNEANNNNGGKLATRGIMTIDDLNIKMGIPEEWAFRRYLSSNNTSLEAFIQADQ